MNPYRALTRPGNMIRNGIGESAGAFIADGPEIMGVQVEGAIFGVISIILGGGG